MAESRDEERREEDIAGGGYQEVAMRLMTALATGTPERMILDVGNAPAGHGGAPPAQRIVPELPADAVLEVLCLVDGDGVHPQPVAPVELGRLGMMSTLRAAERKILARRPGRASRCIPWSAHRSWAGGCSRATSPGTRRSRLCSGRAERSRRASGCPVAMMLWCPGALATRGP